MKKTYCDLCKVEIKDTGALLMHDYIEELRDGRSRHEGGMRRATPRVSIEVENADLCFSCKLKKAEGLLARVKEEAN